jgi:protein TonB
MEPVTAEAPVEEPLVLPEVPLDLVGKRATRPRRSPATPPEPAAPTAPAHAPAAAAPARAAEARGGGALVALDTPTPPYPGEAWRLGLEGTVVIEIAIDPSGRVSVARVAASSGHDLLDDAARSFLLARWRFRPTGETVRRLVPVVYRLR